VVAGRVVLAKRIATLRFFTPRFQEGPVGYAEKDAVPVSLFMGSAGVLVSSGCSCAMSSGRLLFGPLK